jgi:type II secretory pathway pseudopilin PulG
MARALALGVVLWLTGLACAYYGIFGGGMVTLGGLYFSVTRGCWREWRYWLALAVAAAVCMGLIAPFFLPYLELQRETGFSRQLSDVLQYSANGGAWLASSAWAHRWWISAIQGFSEVLFPGFLAIGLGVTGVWLGLRRGTAAPAASRMGRDTVLFYALIAVLTAWFTFGPKAGLYAVLHDNLPVFSFLRAPGRAGIVVTLCLAVLAGVALSRLLEGRRRATLITAAVFVLACAELFQAPLRTREAPPVSPAYQELARMPRAPVAVFPFWGRPSSFHGHSEYMLESTTHWQPLINGYSDHIPQDFRDAARLLGGFPDAASFGELERRGARYVVLHLDLYAGPSRDEVIGKLEAYSHHLRPLSQQDDDTWLFEIVSWPR